MLRAIAFVALALTGCAHYVERTSDVRAAYTAYDEPKALALLDAHFAKTDPGIDQLLVLLDKGMILHAAGRWEESKQVLAQADELSAQLELTSVSEEVGSVLVNEAVRVYRGEEFEKLMISVLQALNYAQLGDDEGALIEVRRCNERLERIAAREHEPWAELAIARYLGGVLYEDQHQWDSAAIDYLKSAQLAPTIEAVALPALRLARQTDRIDPLGDLVRLHPAAPVESLEPGEGQLLVVIEAGQAPRKIERFNRKDASNILAVPSYPAELTPVPRAVVRLGNTQLEAVPLTSLDAVARKDLGARVGKLVARSVANVGIKAALAVTVAVLTKSEDLGVLTFAALSLTQSADTRGWLSLPAEFQVVRTRLKAGRQAFTLIAGGRTTEHEVEIAPGRVKVVVVRRY